MPRKGRTAGKKKEKQDEEVAAPADSAAVAAEAGDLLWDEMKRMGFAAEGTEVHLRCTSLVSAKTLHKA
jgi:hypothetical protein